MKDVQNVDDDDMRGESLMAEILEALDLDSERELRNILQRERRNHDNQ